MTLDQLPKACVILGAGASNDVHNGSSPVTDPDFQPPLAKDLLNIDAHPAYWDVLRHYPGARWLTGQLAGRVRERNFNLEAELRAFADHADPRIREHFKFVPPCSRTG